MKVPHKELLAGEPAFHELAALKGMGALLSHRIGRNFRLFKQTLELYYETRDKILAEHEDKTKRKGDNAFVPPEKQESFRDEMKKLNELEAEVDFHQIEAKDLQERKLDLSPRVWADLHWLIKGEPTESAEPS